MTMKAVWLLVTLLIVMTQANKPKDSSICELPKVVGQCRGAFPKFYYNKDSGECEQFIYGGCMGNENNFETKEECEERCKRA
ncbi:PI-actitoxin-Aeq3b-like [Oculina patagonica]